MRCIIINNELIGKKRFYLVSLSFLHNLCFLVLFDPLIISSIVEKAEEEKKKLKVYPFFLYSFNS